MRHQQHFTEQVQPNWYANALDRADEFERQCEALRRASVVEMPRPDLDYEEWLDERARIAEYR